MSTATLKRIAKTRKYKELVREFPPRVIRDKNTLDATHEVIQWLMGLDAPSGDQLEFLELLSTLVENHELLEYPTPKGSVKELLAHLIESRVVSQADVARESEVSPTTISDVLAGRRLLSRQNVMRLSKYFGVSPTLFLEAMRD